MKASWRGAHLIRRAVAMSGAFCQLRKMASASGGIGRAGFGSFRAQRPHNSPPRVLENDMLPDSGRSGAWQPVHH